jgi:hypothetical protein
MEQLHWLTIGVFFFFDFMLWGKANCTTSALVFVFALGIQPFTVSLVVPRSFRKWYIPLHDGSERGRSSYGFLVFLVFARALWERKMVHTYGWSLGWGGGWLVGLEFMIISYDEDGRRNNNI